MKVEQDNTNNDNNINVNAPPQITTQGLGAANNNIICPECTPARSLLNYKIESKHKKSTKIITYVIPKIVYNTWRFKVVQKKWPKNEKQNGPFGMI